MNFNIGSGLKRLAASVAMAFGLVLVASAGFYVYLKVSGNIHPVEVGIVYRSGQLTGGELEQTIAAHGIRTVLNLRGANPGQSWYDDELAATAARGAAHYDYRLSARRPVTAAQAEEILQLIRNAPKPILVHCKTGADRTGLVSALYQLSRGVPAREAERELSLRFGHFPWLGSRSVAMDNSFRDYVDQAASRSGGAGQAPSATDSATLNPGGAR
jgi:protein tyrosine phosphatase (PTP) superfamily phosphohydrolase (DUF442 family)